MHDAPSFLLLLLLSVRLESLSYLVLCENLILASPARPEKSGRGSACCLIVSDSYSFRLPNMTGYNLVRRWAASKRQEDAQIVQK